MDHNRSPYPRAGAGTCPICRQFKQQEEMTTVVSMDRNFTSWLCHECQDQIVAEAPHQEAFQLRHGLEEYYDDDDGKTPIIHAEIELDGTSVKHPSWFSRWKKYPLSCAGHILQGALAGAMMGWGDTFLITVGILWAVFFIAYQGLSFARKVNQEGRGDTAGLDTVDFLVGLLIVTIIYSIMEVSRAIS